ncbi:MAG: glutamate-ammonia-ligase adenylyltransferase [Francisellaceae bacterium]|jgi:glutamate-ammonia-ligase adenylyltransferase
MESSNTGSEKLWSLYITSLVTHQLEIPTTDNFKKYASHVFSASPFVANFAHRNPILFNHLFSSGDIENLDNEYHTTLLTKLSIKINLTMSEVERDKILRHFRQYETVRIVWQQALGFGDFERHASDISYLAEALIKVTLNDCHKRVILERSLSENLSKLMIIGMGKLGGRELNFSSDIDLIFIHDNDGEVESSRGKVYSKQVLYIQIGQKLINALHKLTPDGFVYRVDMRLRPFGDGSPLTCSLKSFEDYSHKHAREWERYALVKGRILSGPKLGISQLKSIIKDFVYRPYYDYKMTSSIREMKRMIMTEMNKKGMIGHIKLGRGGIREIEFLVQCFQLIYGGQAQFLRSQTFKKPLFMLEKCGYLTKQYTQELYKSYVFLRNFENALQMQGDEQKHCLPTSEVEQKRQCLLLQCENWQDLSLAVQKKRDIVAEIFDRVTQFERESEKTNHTQATKEIEAQITIKADNKSSENISLENDIKIFAHKIEKKKQITDEAKGLILELLPIIGQTIQNDKYINPCESFQLITQLLFKIYKRPTYLYLLLDYKNQISKLLFRFSHSIWFRQKLLNYPFLLEYKFRYNNHVKPMELGFFQEKLEFILTGENVSDKEAQMDLLRKFKLIHTFLIALSAIHKHITVMQLANSLTLLAEVIIREVLDQAWAAALKSTVSLDTKEISILKDSLAIIGYGKLGGHELSLSSDLDLIFLYSETNIPNAERIFPRVAQQFISLMHAQTYSGSLYEIDVRLRPDGASGLLVSSIKAYKDYQQNKAWVWEHQSLARARFICGGKQLESDFKEIRHSVLSIRRDNKHLITEISDMRTKMQKSLLKAYGDRYDLKQSKGGIVDIEFLAQMSVLLYTHDYPEMSEYTDNVRILQISGSINVHSKEDTDLLINAYCFYHELQYEAIFNGSDKIVMLDKVKDFPERVRKIWVKQTSGTTV